MTVALRPYDPDTDRSALWALKRGFERELGEGTGDDAKREAYERKLAGDYRERYLAWVDRCVADGGRCVTVAVDRDGDEDDAEGRPDVDIVGYVFVLPERLAMIRTRPS